ncbi:hypothetical protein HaLaN_33135, partial [Haematococcus lacustris]
MALPGIYITWLSLHYKIDFDNNTEKGMIGRRMCWKDAVQRCEGWPGIVNISDEWKVAAAEENKAGRVATGGEEAQPSAPASKQGPLDLTIGDSDEEGTYSLKPDELIRMPVHGTSQVGGEKKRTAAERDSRSQA